MKKIIAWIRWLLLNGGVGYIIYLALFNNISWANNLIIFYSNIQVVLAIIGGIYYANHKEESRQLSEKKLVPVKFDILYDFVVGLLFASFGWYYIATIWVIQTPFEAVMFSQDKETSPAEGNNKAPGGFFRGFYNNYSNKN